MSAQSDQNTNRDRLAKRKDKTSKIPGEAANRPIDGATMLAAGPTSLLEIGQRNTAAVAAALAKAGLTPVVTDTGGSKGRNVTLQAATGYVTVKVLAQPDRVYADLTLGPEVGQ